MKRWKECGLKLLFPPVWVVLVLVIFSAAALTEVFINGRSETAAAYAVYVISFYSLTVLCLCCWKTLPTFCSTVKGKIDQSLFLSRYLSDAAFKTHVSLYRALAINLLYASVNAVFAAVYHTMWFAIFAVYYAILAVMRFLLIRYVSCNKLGESRLAELKCASACAWILLAINPTLSGAVLMMVYMGRGFEYHGFLIYVMALYTFYITAAAIRDMIKYRSFNSPVMSVSKVIQLTAALMSMLSLETAMLSQFGAELSARDEQSLIIATGAGISVIVVTMAVYMIVQSTKEIKRIKAYE